MGVLVRIDVKEKDKKIMGASGWNYFSLFAMVGAYLMANISPKMKF